MKNEIIHIQTHENDDWIFGETREENFLIGTWMKLKKKNMWFQNSFEDIIIKNMKIPISTELLKQCKKYEGSVDFLHSLSYMCRSEEITLTEKQINFLIRILLENYDIPILALKYFCMSGIKAGISSKDIEKKLKEIREKYDTSMDTHI